MKLSLANSVEVHGVSFEVLKAEMGSKYVHGCPSSWRPSSQRRPWLQGACWGRSQGICNTASLQPEDNAFRNRRRTESLKLAANNSAAAANQDQSRGKSNRNNLLLLSLRSHTYWKAATFMAHVGNQEHSHHGRRQLGILFIPGLRVQQRWWCFLLPHCFANVHPHEAVEQVASPESSKTGISVHQLSKHWHPQADLSTSNGNNVTVDITRHTNAYVYV